MAEAFSLSSCSSTLAPESKLSRRPEAQYGLVSRLRHHEWKNLKNHFSQCKIGISGVMRSLFLLVGYAQPVFLAKRGFSFFRLKSWKDRWCICVIWLWACSKVKSCKCSIKDVVSSDGTASGEPSVSWAIPSRDRVRGTQSEKRGFLGFCLTRAGLNLVSQHTKSCLSICNLAWKHSNLVWKHSNLVWNQ